MNVGRYVHMNLFGRVTFGKAAKYRHIVSEIIGIIVGKL
jgi:hypothetical protein